MRYVIRCNTDATEWALVPVKTTGYAITDTDSGRELPVVFTFDAPDWDTAMAIYEAYCEKERNC